MIPKECKRLAEVDFPIAVVSKHSAREKSIRHGHPSTLHLWWARRPLAACRAMLMALLLPDPADPNCPEAFKAEARRVLGAFPSRPSRWGDQMRTDEGLRGVLLEFIGDFANWDNSAKPAYLACARGLVKAAHPEETPLVVDPFAGGGSIPLEALRLGCEAFASDLNPVACLILKVMLEDIPRHGPQLAEELRRVGGEIKRAAEQELAEFYPKDPDGATPIAYLWARTVRCEAPSCGAEIPLVRSFWLCKKAKRRRALRHRVVRPAGEPPRVEFEVFEPKTERDVPAGTVTRAKATCLCCGSVLPPERVRAQLSAQRGGANPIFDAGGRRVGGARLLAVVLLKPGEPGRHYRLPTERDYQAVQKAQARLAAILEEWERGGRQGLCPVPDEPTPTKKAHRAVGSQLPLYGSTRWKDMLTNRQCLAMMVLCSHVHRVGYQRVQCLLSMACNKVAMQNSAMSRWKPTGESLMDSFGRQTLGIMWSFAEANVLSGVTADFSTAIDSIANTIMSNDWLTSLSAASVVQSDSCQLPLPDQACSVFYSDPPYYDMVPFADLSDFFYVWVKRAMGTKLAAGDPYDPRNTLTPKRREIVVHHFRRAGDGAQMAAHFERRIRTAFEEARRVLRPGGLGSIFFAHKSTEGWESLLSGLVDAGWTVTGSWPLTTEMASRLNARDSAALATSVHLVCRPRPDDAPVGDWGEVLRELPKRVGDWMERLQAEGVRGADLVFACIGPALEIYSRYAKVETAEGREVALAEYLEKVWEVVGRTALEQVLGTAEAKARNGAAGALEEDARLTALFLWTLQATAEGEGNHRGDAENAEEEAGDEDVEDEEGTGGDARASRKKGFSLVYDVARRFAQPLGIHLEAWEGRIIETEKGVVRLLPVLERAQQLFGEEGAGAIADRIERSPTAAAAAQMALFPDPAAAPKVRGRERRANVADSGLATRREATTLDRVHAAMLLQAGGRANALRALLKAEMERGPDFLRLANALSALYPQGSDEKRLVDAMLLAVPR